MKGKMFKQILLVLMVINTFSGSLEDQLFTALDQKDVVKKIRGLIKSGANVDARDNQSYTLLMIAARDGWHDVVDLLIRFGANLDFKSVSGKTALMFAAEYNYYDALKLLINAGADVNLKDDLGITALIYAVKHTPFCRNYIVEMLIANGADINIRDAHGKTAIFYARGGRYWQDAAIRDILIKAGAIE